MRVSFPFRFKESTTNEQLFKGGFIVKYQKNKCVLFETRMFDPYQLLLGYIERLHSQEKIKAIKLWTNLRHYRCQHIYIICHRGHFILPCTLCSNTLNKVQNRECHGYLKSVFSNRHTWYIFVTRKNLKYKKAQFLRRFFASKIFLLLNDVTVYVDKVLIETKPIEKTTG